MTAREFRPPQRHRPARLVIAAVVAVLTLAPAGLFLAMATGHAQVSYSIRSGELLVETGDLFVGRRRIALADITRSRAVNLRGGSRTMGTALPGYCVGRYRYPDLGTVWQATDCSGRAIMLTVRGESLPIVLTPPDRDAFLARLARGQETTIVLPPPLEGGLTLLLLAMAGVALTIAGMLAAVLIAGPSRMRYRFEAGSLEVQTMFRRHRWPTVGMRARRHRLHVGLRLAGTAAPGYYTGIFRADKRTTRVYATRLTDGVLIEGPARVFVSPEDPEAFLTELRHGGATVDDGGR